MAAVNALVPVSQKTGILLVNLGTPDSTEVADVRRYLREFLNDPRVIDIHPVGRWFLLNLIILPFRPAKSAEAYRTIWTDEGSPLLFHGVALAEGVQQALGDSYQVELAMRYGTPSIPSVLEKMMAQDLDNILVVPLYPQYSSAATGSTLDRVFQLVGEQWNVPTIEAMGPFYDDPDFIDAFKEVSASVLEDFQPDHILMSYHGLPERQIYRGDPSGQHCLKKGNCCDKMGSENRYCYRAHCFATSRALAEALQIDESSYTVGFQSRLGRTPWIQPYTDKLLGELVKKGHKKLAVMCPAFVADCLETIEEIGIRAAEDWKAEGGEELILVPSLNSHPRWIDAVAKMVKHRLGRL